MTRIFLGVSGLLALGLAFLWWENSRLKDRNAILRASVVAFEANQERLEETARVHRAFIARLQNQERENAARLREIQELEGGDAPLSDFMRDAAGIVWQ